MPGLKLPCHKFAFNEISEIGRAFTSHYRNPLNEHLSELTRKQIEDVRQRI